MRKSSKFEECDEQISWAVNASAELVFLYPFAYFGGEQRGPLRELYSSYYFHQSLLTDSYYFSGIVPAAFTYVVSLNPPNIPLRYLIVIPV